MIRMLFCWVSLRCSVPARMSGIKRADVARIVALRILAAWLMSKCSFPQGFCHRTVIFIHIHPFSSIFLLDLAAGLFGFVHGVARRTAVSTQTLMWRRRDALTLFYRLPRMPAWAFYLARHIAVPPRSAGEPGECE